MHIHIPDGVLPLWLWLAGYLVITIILAVVWPHLKKQTKKTPLVAMMTALALLTMSIPLALPVHLNLLVLIGLLLGIPWSLVVALVVNFMLASLGHGGLTIVGLNSLLLWIQMVSGILLFRFFAKSIKNYFTLASLATFISFLAAFVLLIGLVGLAKINPLETSDYDHEHYEMEHEHETQSAEQTQISLKTFTILSFPIFLFSAVIESLLTGFIIQFIRKTKPRLIHKT